MSPSDANSLLHKLTRCAWEFSRADGSILAAALQLQAGGRVLNNRHSIESYWKVESGRLCLLDRNKKLVTIFTDQTRLPDGRQAFRGASLRKGAPVVHVLTETRLPSSAILDSPPRVAVLIRTHLDNAKTKDLVSILSGTAYFDVFVAADCSSAELAFDGIPVLRHRASDAQALGLPTEKERLLWHCGDYALYFSFVKIPVYDYYVMIEYDVHIANRSPLILEGIINRLGFSTHAPLEFVGARCYKGSFERGWGRTIEGIYPEPLQCFFPFIVVSRRALEYLLDERRTEASRQASTERIMFCEAFVPSALNAAGFQLADVNNLIPTAVNGASFRILGDAGPMLLGQKTHSPTPWLLHPVYDEESFVEYHIDKARRAGDVSLLDSLACRRPELPLSARARKMIDRAVVDLQ